MSLQQQTKDRITGVCGKCNSKFEAKYTQVGRSFPCPQCQEPITVAVPAQVPNEPPKMESEIVAPAAQLTCPKCNAQLQLNQLGRQTLCRSCNSLIAVPFPNDLFQAFIIWQHHREDERRSNAKVLGVFMIVLGFLLFAVNMIVVNVAGSAVGAAFGAWMFFTGFGHLNR